MKGPALVPSRMAPRSRSQTTWEEVTTAAGPSGRGMRRTQPLPTLQKPEGVMEVKKRWGRHELGGGYGAGGRDYKASAGDKTDDKSWRPTQERRKRGLGLRGHNRGGGGGIEKESITTGGRQRLWRRTATTSGTSMTGAE